MTAGGRGKGRPKLTETAEIDRAIRDAALQVLLEQGEAATMNAVAVAAGLSRKTLYARYPNKTDLFVAVIGELLQAAGNLSYDRSGSVEDRLLHYVEAAFTAISRPQSKAIQQLLSIDSTYIAVLKADMLAAIRRIFLDPLLALLTEARQSGEIVVDDVESTARVVIRAIFTEAMISERGQAFWLAHRRQEDYARFLTRLIIRGLAPR